MHWSSSFASHDVLHRLPVGKLRQQFALRLIRQSTKNRCETHYIVLHNMYSSINH